KVVQLKVDPVNNVGEVLDVGNEVEIVHVDDQQFPIAVIANPFFVMLIQVFEILETDGILVVAPAFFNLTNKFWNVRFQIDQQIRRTHEVYHRIKKIEITLVIALRYEPASIEIRREDVCILIDRAVLNGSPFASADLVNLLKPCIQKIYLNMI